MIVDCNRTICFISQADKQRRPYKGMDDFTKSISITDDYINDAYDDSQRKYDLMDTVISSS